MMEAETRIVFVPRVANVSVALIDSIYNNQNVRKYLMNALITIETLENVFLAIQGISCLMANVQQPILFVKQVIALDNVPPVIKTTLFHRVNVTDHQEQPILPQEL